MQKSLLKQLSQLGDLHSAGKGGCELGASSEPPAPVRKGTRSPSQTQLRAGRGAAGQRGDPGALGGAGTPAHTPRTCASVDLQTPHAEVAGGAGVDAHPVLADAVPPDEQEEPVVAGDAAVVLRAQDAARAVLKEPGAHCGDKGGGGAAAGGTAGPGIPPCCAQLRVPARAPRASDRALTPGAAGG